MGSPSYTKETTFRDESTGQKAKKGGKRRKTLLEGVMGD
jgi:hypothetical protein